MAWDQAAWEAKQKRKEDIERKLSILSSEGSELGEGAAATLDFLESNADYIVGEEIVARCYDEAEESCDAYFKQVARSAEAQYANGYAGGDYSELVAINEELEAKGLCPDHPYQATYTAPTNGCDRCIRIYIKKQDAK